MVVFAGREMRYMCVNADSGAIIEHLKQATPWDKCLFINLCVKWERSPHNLQQDTGEG